MIEMHAAGYLLYLSSPRCSIIRDEYGGSLENRLRYPLEVCQAMRVAWPQEKPMSVRISAHDWMGDSGITEGEALLIARAFIDAGADIINVSTGQTSHAAQPQPGRMFQALSDIIQTTATYHHCRGEHLRTDHMNSIIAQDEQIWFVWRARILLTELDATRCSGTGLSRTGRRRTAPVLFGLPASLHLG